MHQATSLPPASLVAPKPVAAPHVAPAVVFSHSPLLEPPPLPVHVAPKEGDNQALLRAAREAQAASTLPKEIVDALAGLDAEREELQYLLQAELDDLSANSTALRVVQDRIDKLRARNNAPSLSAVEPERQQLIARMESWVRNTSAQCNHATGQLRVLQRKQQLDGMTQAIDRLNPSATTHGATDAREPPQQQRSYDPTARLSDFFDALTRKEREVREKEATLDRLRVLERREKRLQSEVTRLEHVKSVAVNAQPTHQSFLDRTRDEYAAQLKGPTGPTNTGGVFRFDLHSDTEKRAGTLNMSSSAPFSPPQMPSDYAHRTSLAVLTTPRQQHHNQTSAAASSGAPRVSVDNPYSTSRQADRQRMMALATDSVTKRLEAFLTDKNRANRTPR